MNQIPEHITNVGAGWWTALGILHRQLVKIVPEYEVAQVKEKFGGLRVSVDLPESADHDRAYKAIEAAEHVSEYTCEQCGGPTEGSKKGPTGWIRTLCDSCWGWQGD